MLRSAAAKHAPASGWHCPTPPHPTHPTAPHLAGHGGADAAKQARRLVADIQVRAARGGRRRQVRLRAGARHLGHAPLAGAVGVHVAPCCAQGKGEDAAQSGRVLGENTVNGISTSSCTP